MSRRAIVVGAGLAGSEAAWQLAKRGVEVTLLEMRPHVMTPAHQSGRPGELVCSNSFRAESRENAVGLLKEEMQRMDSLILRCARETRVPAGGALAVDREGFARCVEQKLEESPGLEIVREEAETIPSTEGGPVVIASGPLTSEALAADIRRYTGEEQLHFFDAAAPIIIKESLGFNRLFRASRYNRGESDAYINCPLTRDEYGRFWEALVEAELHPVKDFEPAKLFEGCMPVEELARRGRETLRFGPMKPVGLVDPRTGQEPYAVVQLRQDNSEGTLYNMVGFQTRLKWGEQARVFRLITGLERAEFVRFGVMHRNTFLSAPALLEPSYQCRQNPDLFFAGQITGVEGYVESASSGLLAGINAARRVRGHEAVFLPPETAAGALAHYIARARPQGFQPMNVNFGLLPPWPRRVKKKRERNLLLAERALKALEDWQGGTES